MDSESKRITVYIGWDSREPFASEVAKSSLLRRTKCDIDIKFLKHKELRKAGIFKREWLISFDGTRTDISDNRQFSTEYSYTRFLVPYLNNFSGFALYIDGDVFFKGKTHGDDIIKDLFNGIDHGAALSCVKHYHMPSEIIKSDGQEQSFYEKKNWSSVVLWDCSNPLHRILTPYTVNHSNGKWLHQFKWLNDSNVGSLEERWNWLEGYSDGKINPRIVHFTRGGCWFKEYEKSMYSDLWFEEYEYWQKNNQELLTALPTIKYGG